MLVILASSQGTYSVVIMAHNFHFDITLVPMQTEQDLKLLKWQWQWDKVRTYLTRKMVQQDMAWGPGKETKVTPRFLKLLRLC